MTQLAEWWENLSPVVVILGTCVTAMVVAGLVMYVAIRHAPLVDEDGTVPREGYVRDLSGKERRVR